MQFKISDYLLFILIFLSIFFGQITDKYGDRISLPFRFFEIIFFFLYLLSKITKKIKINIFILIFLVYFSIITILSIILNYDKHIKIYPYPLVSLYIYLHTIVVFYFTASFNLKGQKLNLTVYKLIAENILKFSSFIAVLLYLLHLIFLNNSNLGVNYHSIPIPRAMGILPEPSLYSISAWIFFYYCLFSDKYSLASKIFYLFAFIISFAATGFIFAILSILFFLLFNIKSLKNLIFFIIILFFYFLIPDEYLYRFYERSSHEFILIYNNLFSNNMYSNALGELSRVEYFFHQFQYLKNNFYPIILGLGGGGQTLLTYDLIDIFRGPFHILAEAGALGFFLTFVLVFKIYTNCTSNFKPLFIAYLFISFFNPFGGNFGFDFIFILLVIQILSLSSVKMSHIT